MSSIGLGDIDVRVDARAVGVESDRPATVIDLRARPVEAGADGHAGASTPAPVTSGRLDRALKSGFDRAAALLLLVVLSPVLVAIAIAIKATSPGPVLFRQTRVGQHGRPFRFVKFRTMVIDAEDRLIDLRDRNECDGVLFKIRDDPRTTTVGRWLRRFSLDELPQVWHVLTGDMSLVGPRPALPEEVAAYEPGVERRLEVKPGLTGLWQVSGRSDLQWADAVRLDLHYVEQWSLGLDLRILVKTVPAVLTGRGAY